MDRHHEEQRRAVWDALMERERMSAREAAREAARREDRSWASRREIGREAIKAAAVRQVASMAVVLMGNYLLRTNDVDLLRTNDAGDPQEAVSAVMDCAAKIAAELYARCETAQRNIK
jgi:hypothetical protein